MRFWKRGLTVILSAGMLAALCAGTAFAAEDREKISSVSLTLDYSFEEGEEGGDLTVLANGSNYDVTDVFIVNDDDEWASGDVPEIKVTLEAESDYYFASMSKSKVKLKGDKATYSSSRREDDHTVLVITLKLGEIEGTMEVTEVCWENDNSPIATWEKAGGAKEYQVRLYRGNTSVASTVTTTNLYYNFSENITREGEYYFKVRAVSSSNKKGDTYESDAMYVDSDLLNRIRSGYYTQSNNTGSTANAPGPSRTGTWVRDNVNWWYRYSDGTYPTNGWLQINNVWYCFDSVGYIRTGWIIASDGRYYYCDPREGSSQGAMLTNQRTPDGYWVGADGAWVQGQ